MSTFSDLRADLKTKLEDADFNAFTIVPETATAPFAFVAPDTPYIAYEADSDLTFGNEVLVRHRIVLVAEAGANDVQADALDEALLTVLGLELDPHVVQEVDEPGRLSINNQPHLAVAIHLAAPVRLES